MDTIVNFLVSFNNLLGGQLGLTLIVLGVGVRLVFAPLIKQQLAHAKKMQDLQPKLQALKKQHGDDKAKLAQEQAKMFQENGVNPAAGCLPMVAQMVVFIFLYNAIRHLLRQGISTQWLWWDLSKPDVHVIPGLPFPLPGIWILLAAGTQLMISKMMLPQPVPVEKTDKPKEVEEKTDLADDIQRMQGSMVYMFPLMFVFLGYQFPTGLSLYWTASTAVAVWQQYRYQGWGGLEGWIGKISKIK